MFDICKNLLCGKVCSSCNNIEDDFKIIEASFPYNIPNSYQLVFIEKVMHSESVIITAYIRNNVVYIKAEDYDVYSKYHIHFQYPYCKLTKSIIPDNKTCDYFTEAKHVL